MKKSIPTPVIAGVAAVAILVLAIFAYRSLSDPPTPRPDPARFQSGPPKTVPPTAP